jgi:hypothetical protein
MRTDEQLRIDVVDILSREPAFAGLELLVTVKNAVVTLSGEVHSELEKWSVEKAASRVWDAAETNNCLAVVVSEAGQRVDDDMVRSGQPLCAPISEAQLKEPARRLRRARPAGGGPRYP